MSLMLSVGTQICPGILPFYCLAGNSLEILITNQLKEDRFPLQLRVKGKGACSQLLHYMN